MLLAVEKQRYSKLTLPSEERQANVPCPRRLSCLHEPRSLLVHPWSGRGTHATGMLMEEGEPTLLELWLSAVGSGHEEKSRGFSETPPSFTPLTWFPSLTGLLFDPAWRKGKVRNWAKQKHPHNPAQLMWKSHQLSGRVTNFATSFPHSLGFLQLTGAKLQLAGWDHRSSLVRVQNKSAMSFLSTVI